MKLNHRDISNRFAQGVEPLGSVGPKASGLADMMAGLVTAPVRAIDRAIGVEPPRHNISSIVPNGMG